MPAFPCIGRLALRQGRVSIPSQIHLLTTTTQRRERLFVDPARARIASRVIPSSSTWGDASLLAWVLMPDHWHGLLQLGNEPLARVMNRFKGNLARAQRIVWRASASVGPQFPRPCMARRRERTAGREIHRCKPDPRWARKECIGLSVPERDLARSRHVPVVGAR
jgi:REP element-mobilizing transposase RayT